MELIHYATGSVLTGSEIAHALLAYARALAEKATSATIDIPIREKDGTLGRANFLIGPASQIVSETISSENATRSRIPRWWRLSTVRRKNWTGCL